MNKRFSTLSLFSTLLLILLFVGILSCETKEITKPDVPDKEEPKDPAPDEPEFDYKVWINGVEAIVYEARVQDPPFEKRYLEFGGNYSFVSFDIDGPVEVKIKSGNKVLSETILRPESSIVSEFSKSNKELSFIVENPMQLIVEPDGKNGPLLLFANRVEDFNLDLDDPNLIYYGAGVHHPTDALINLGDNQTLYVDDGAIVNAGVHVHGNNVTICGRGIICGNEFVWGGFSRHLIQLYRSNNVVVKDVILRGGATWSMVMRESKNITVDNIKVVGGRAQNDDGINPVNSQDVKIQNCFIRTDDDCIAVKGMVANTLDVERITVENCILWCDRARIFLLGHESRAFYMRDLKFKNIDIVHFSMTAFLLEPGENMRLENVVFEDIRINGEGQNELIRLKPLVNQYMHTKVPGFINNITFKDVSVTGKGGFYKIQLYGADKSHNVNNVKFEDVYILNRKVTENYDYLEKGDFIHNLHIK